MFQIRLEPTESVIPIKKENKQVKESDLLRKISKGRCDVNIREPRSCEKTIGQLRSKLAVTVVGEQNLFSPKNTAFGPRMMTMVMRMMGI